LKKLSSQKKENVEPQETHIEFAKPLYKKNSLPAYPVIARKRGYQGTVELMVLVSEKGKVSSLKIFKSSGYKSIDRQAVKTVKTWLFEPGKKQGIPQEMWVKIPVKFELNQQKK
ncbi:MAG: energy transducer TonB, partial [Desulfobacterales bacterium]|nr:energy transducer TonB [Desulfobacterales bacterium]